MEKNIIWLPFRKFGKLYIFFFILLFMLKPCVYGQNQNVKNSGLADPSAGIITEMDDETIKAFNERAIEKLAELQNYIIIVGSKQEADENRNFAIEAAAKLFIKEAIMQVSNVKTGQITDYRPIKKYFLRLKSLPFIKVEITFYQTAYISGLRAGTDGRYYGTATVYQEFKGYHADGGSYSDRTVKTLDIVLEYIDDKFYGEKRWELLFGDVKVAETRNI